MDGTRIRLLGPVDLLRDGVPYDVPGRSLRTLLAILSLRTDEVVSRDQLVEALWPGRASATAVNTMQRHLSSLRGLLTGVATISARPPGYVLSPVAVDLLSPARRPDVLFEVAVTQKDLTCAARCGPADAFAGPTFARGPSPLAPARRLPRLSCAAGGLCCLPREAPAGGRQPDVGLGATRP